MFRFRCARSHSRPSPAGLARRVRITLLLPLLLAGADGLWGQGTDALTRLSLDEALELAQRFNPDFRIQRSQEEVADRQVRAARGDLLPNLSVSNSYGYQASGERRVGSIFLGSQPDYYSSSYGMNLSYSLNGASLLRPALVAAEADAARARLRGAAQGLQAEVTNAYLTVLQADAQVVQARTALERTRLTVRQASAQAEVGLATPLDVRRAEVQEGQAEVQLIQSQGQARAARLNLERVLGVTLAEDVQLTTDFSAEIVRLDVEALLVQALDDNPVVRATRLSEQASRVGLRSARTAFLPNLSFSAGYSGSIFVAGDTEPLITGELASQAGRFQACLEDNRIRALLGDAPRDCQALNPVLPQVEASIRQRVEDQNSGYPFNYRRQPLSLSVSISLPVFTAGQRRRAVEQADLELTNVREQLRAEELRLRAEVSTAVQNVETSRQVVALQERIRATASEELRLAQERFRLGLASSIEVADAQANLSQAERDEISARYEFQRTIAALEALIGGSLRP
jgi:outer membrane protein